MPMGFAGGFQVFILFQVFAPWCHLAGTVLNHDQHLMFYYMVVSLDWQMYLLMVKPL